MSLMGHIVALENIKTVQHKNSGARNEMPLSFKRFKKRVREDASRKYGWRTL